MTKHPFYLAFGIAVLVLVAMAEAKGWGMSTPSEVKDIPRTVRDNPGSYRPHYTFIGYGTRRGK
jgi:hypothetical protein